MDRLFQRIIDHNFSDLPGTRFDAVVPVPQSLVNELISAALRGNRTIESCDVFLHEHNRVSADLKTTLLPWSFHLKLKVDDSVDFASYSSPKVRAWLENNLLLGRLGAFFNALPAGIKLYGNQVVLDIGAFFPDPRQKQILTLVKSVKIRTEEGKIILDILAEV